MARLAARGSRKKLEEAARVWAKGDASDQPAQAEQLDESLAAFGLFIEPEERVPADPEYFEVWPENWQALVFFSGLQTQWRHDGMNGTVLGLDYSGIEALMRIKRMPNRAALMADIQTMERAAMAVLNTKHGQ